MKKACVFGCLLLLLTSCNNRVKVDSSEQLKTDFIDNFLKKHPSGISYCDGIYEMIVDSSIYKITNNINDKVLIETSCKTFRGQISFFESQCPMLGYSSNFSFEVNKTFNIENIEEGYTSKDSYFYKEKNFIHKKCIYSNNETVDDETIVEGNTNLNSVNLSIYSDNYYNQLASINDDSSILSSSFYQNGFTIERKITLDNGDSCFVNNTYDFDENLELIRNYQGYEVLDSENSKYIVYSLIIKPYKGSIATETLEYTQPYLSDSFNIIL